MVERQQNIAIVSDDPVRAEFFSDLLQDVRNRKQLLNFTHVLRGGLTDFPFDVIFMDCVSAPEFDYQKFQEQRTSSKLKQTSFVFLLNPSQEAVKRQVYKNSNNFILLEPADRFIFISTINNAFHLKNLEKSTLLYKEMIEGEKKLISNMDNLLEMGRIQQMTDEAELLTHLEKSFIRRLELVLAVETALFTTLDTTNNVLSFNLFDDHGEQLNRKYTFELEKSQLKELLNKNYSQILEGTALTDPLIQELEEAIGLKIFSLLFIPIMVFHEPKGGIILINKLYRDEFTENDLSFSLIAAQKITYHLEKIQLSAQQTMQSVTASALKLNRDVIYDEWKLLKYITESVSFGIIVFDEHLDIHFMNPSAFRILNKEQQNSSFRNLFQLLDEHAFNKILTYVKRNQFPVIRDELELNAGSRPHFFIGYSIYSFPSQQAEMRYIMVFSEISRSKRIQAEVIRMDRMASLGALSSGIAHEIRNPLAGIKAMVQSLEEQLDDDALKMEYIQRILRQVNRLEKLLRSFFSYASPVRPDPVPARIDKIVEEVLPLIDRKLMEKKIRIKQEYAPDLAEVFVDTSQIQQVLLNLFLNAIDAMPEGGLLQISALNALHSKPIVDRRNPSAGLLSDSFIQIEVQDNGIGISEKVCKKIFDPFYTTKTSGTGLGLSIVYQIIKEHGGRIDVNSKEKKGTVFTILLPAYDKK